MKILAFLWILLLPGIAAGQQSGCAFVNIKAYCPESIGLDEPFNIKLEYRNTGSENLLLFLDDFVYELIDTTGRYVAQKVFAERPRSEWQPQLFPALAVKTKEMTFGPLNHDHYVQKGTYFLKVVYQSTHPLRKKDYKAWSPYYFYDCTRVVYFEKIVVR